MNFEMEDLIPVVAELATRYTSNESTSVSYDKAGQLMGAVIFCIEEYEKTEPETLVAASKPSAFSIYCTGYELVCKKTKDALSLYHKIMEDFSAYKNEALHDTIVKGMPAFFQYYDPQFQPQNRILTLDYPTLYQVEHLQGIDAIYQYLAYIQKEQQFLQTFSENYIETALQDYQEDPDGLFLNIPSVVMRYAMKMKKGTGEISLQEWADMEKQLAKKMYGV